MRGSEYYVYISENSFLNSYFCNYLCIYLETKKRSIINNKLSLTNLKNSNEKKMNYVYKKIENENQQNDLMKATEIFLKSTLGHELIFKRTSINDSNKKISRSYIA